VNRARRVLAEHRGLARPIPRPMPSPPMSANGPTGICPPNSSAMPVRTHGTGSPRAAHAVAYGLWV
jgi:hypothetical protein